MADKSITDLTALDTFADSDLLVVADASADNIAKKMTGLQLKTYATADIVSANATTLAAGASATASFNPSTKVLSLGIPQGLQGEQGIQGETGATGATGRGLTVLGYYATVSALEAAVTDPVAGDAYGIGSADPYDIYIWDGVNNTWVDNGAIQGPNEVTTSTETNITGLLKGNGSNVVAAVAGTDYATPDQIAGAVIVTINNNSSTYTADMTYAEIVAAYNAGKVVLAKTTGGYSANIFYLNAVTASLVIFEIITGVSGNLVSGSISISSSNVITISASSPLGRTDAVTDANTDYSTVMARGISAGTTDLTAGTSSLTSGTIYLVYE